MILGRQDLDDLFVQLVGSDGLMLHAKTKRQLAEHQGLGGTRLAQSNHGRLGDETCQGQLHHLIAVDEGPVEGVS